MIIIKGEEELKYIRKACRIAAEVLLEIKGALRPGVITLELDDLAERLLLKAGALPAFKGYRGYKYATCLSVNNEVVHGLPTGRVLKEGDIIGVDIGAQFGGFYGDVAATYPVGRIGKTQKKLIDTTLMALYMAIEKARPHGHLGDISATIESVAKKAHFSVVKDLFGHGIGKSLHEDPLIPNFGTPGEGPELKPGMVLAIEPMLNSGSSEIKTLPDQWTIVTADEGLSAHFEHTVAITDDGREVLTELK